MAITRQHQTYDPKTDDVAVTIGRDNRFTRVSFGGVVVTKPSGDLVDQPHQVTIRGLSSFELFLREDEDGPERCIMVARSRYYRGKDRGRRDIVVVFAADGRIKSVAFDGDAPQEEPTTFRKEPLTGSVTGILCYQFAVVTDKAGLRCRWVHDGLTNYFYRCG